MDNIELKQYEEGNFLSTRDNARISALPTRIQHWCATSKSFLIPLRVYTRLNNNIYDDSDDAEQGNDTIDKVAITTMGLIALQIIPDSRSSKRV